MVTHTAARIGCSTGAPLSFESLYASDSPWYSQSIRIGSAGARGRLLLNAGILHNPNSRMLLLNDSSSCFVESGSETMLLYAF